MTMTIRIIPNDKGAPADKLADVELRFHEGPLEGLRLIGFMLWRQPSGAVQVGWPSRSYSVNGERRAFALLRPASNDSRGSRAREVLDDSIREAFATYQRLGINTPDGSFHFAA